MSKNKFLLGVFVVIVIVAGVIIYLGVSFTSKATKSLPGPVEKPDIDITSGVKDMVDVKTKLKDTCSTATDQNFDSKTDQISQNLNSYSEKINLAVAQKNLSAKNYDTYNDEINSFIAEFNACYTKLNSITKQQSGADKFRFTQNQQVLDELQRQNGEVQKQKDQLYSNKGK
jgi:uncharacterized protein YukE